MTIFLILICLVLAVTSLISIAGVVYLWFMLMIYDPKGSISYWQTPNDPNQYRLRSDSARDSSNGPMAMVVRDGKVGCGSEVFHKIKISGNSAGIKTKEVCTTETDEKQRTETKS